MEQQYPKPPPQISEMFSKFALAVKTKTIEFFAEEGDDDPESNPNGDGFLSLLDSAEEVIPDQKVVVIKPDEVEKKLETVSEEKIRPISPIDPQIGHALISSICATVSSFQASYLQLQAAHVPISEEGIAVADKAAVLQLKRLSELKQFYRDLKSRGKVEVGNNSVGSCLEARVQENQSKLRALGTVSNQLQLEIDVKDAQVVVLRKELEKCRIGNAKLSKRLAMSPGLSSSSEVLMTVGVFSSVLSDSVKAVHKFTKLLICLMKRAKWDLDLAASWVHPGVEYEKKGHMQYAFLSYVCLLFLKDFDSENFGLGVSDEKKSSVNSSLRQLVEHVSANPFDVLSRDPSSDFSRFCEIKYQELIHPTMETSIFGNLKQDKAVIESWKSMSVFYESFVHMASSVWTLHKLSLSFDPVVEIFQVEKGADFSVIYMEDVIKRNAAASRNKAKVGFTVVPGFKFGGTSIQCQVYLAGMKCKG